MGTVPKLQVGLITLARAGQRGRASRLAALQRFTELDGLGWTSCYEAPRQDRWYRSAAALVS